MSKKLSLGEKLFKLFQDGLYSDVQICITSGSEEIQVRAHKVVLCAMSDVLAAYLSNPNWESNNVIHFPPQIGEDAGWLFIKYFYTEDISRDTTPEVLLQILALAHFYNVGEAVERCEKLLSLKISTENCVEIFENTSDIDSFGKIWKKSYDHMKKQIYCLMTTVKNEGCSWKSETWKKLLSEDYLAVKEVLLFESLLKWKSECAVCEAEFKELVNLIRFPLMTAEEFREKVVPQKVLQDSDTISLFSYITQDNETRIPVGLNFNAYSRQRRVASNAEELKKLLKSAYYGDTVELLPVEYMGVFKLKRDRITIVGSLRPQAGEEDAEASVIRGSLTIEGNYNSIKNMTMILDYEITGDRCAAVTISGHDNLIKNFEIKGSDENPENLCEKDEAEHSAVHIKGQQNSCEGIVSTLNDYMHIGVTLEGNENTLKEMKFANGTTGLVIHGKNHNIENMEFMDLYYGIILNELTRRNSIKKIHFSQFNPPLEDENIVALNVEGSYHTIYDVTCVGLEREAEEDNVFFMDMEAESSHVEVKHCRGGPVSVRGASHELINVDASPFLRIAGEKHHLVNCTTRQLQYDRVRGDGVIAENCDFFLGVDENSSAGEEEE